MSRFRGLSHTIWHHALVVVMRDPSQGLLAFLVVGSTRARKVDA